MKNATSEAHFLIENRPASNLQVANVHQIVILPHIQAIW